MNFLINQSMIRIERGILAKNTNSLPAFSLFLGLKADFHTVEFSDWTGNPQLMCENVALNLKRMSCMTKILLSKIQSARKILLNGN